jgi:hypothetical protein
MTDGLVRLVQKTDRLRTLRLVYVRAEGRATITGIPLGTYVVRYTLGEDWQEQTRQFARVLSHQQFVEPFEFAVRRDPSGRTLVETLGVTLHSFSGGSAWIQVIPLDTSDDEVDEGS